MIRLAIWLFFHLKDDVMFSFTLTVGKNAARKGQDVFVKPLKISSRFLILFLIFRVKLC